MSTSSTSCRRYFAESCHVLLWIRKQGLILLKPESRPLSPCGDEDLEPKFFTAMPRCNGDETVTNHQRSAAASAGDMIRALGKFRAPDNRRKLLSLVTKRSRSL
jgi:hypothetical protein